MPAAGEKLRVWGVCKGERFKNSNFCPPQAENFEGESLRFLYTQYTIFPASVREYKKSYTQV